MFLLDRILGRKKDDIALLVDGPNVIRKSLKIDLVKVKREVQKHGNLRVSRIYLDQYASEKLIEAMVNQGFDVQITAGDVDVTMAVDATELAMSKGIDTVALMTRDSDYIPVLNKAKKHGKRTMIIATDVAFSAALKNTSDIVLIFKGKDEADHIINQ
jgi:uncharacterized protein (TIGR00288 family)